MLASWRALPEIDGAWVIRIDEALECARLLVEDYLLIVPLRPDAHGRYRVHGDEVAITAGRTQLREPGDVQLTLDRRSTSVRVLWLPVAYVEAVARALGWPAAPHWRGLAVDDPTLFAAQRQLHADLEGGGCEDLEVALRQLVSLALERHGDRRPHAGRGVLRELAAVREHLRLHLAERVTLAELAAIDGIQAQHLAHMFTAAFGVAPDEYQILLRVNAARALLTAGASLAGAAAQVGFTDPAQLTRHFRRAFAVTPVAYLRDLAAGPLKHR